jgi:hypothetical protein
MRIALRVLLYLFGAVCSMIALTHIAFGPGSIPGGVVTNATMDSEDRFYATLFLGFGLAIIWCARDLASREKPLSALLSVFFAGGIARIVSLIAAGSPGPLFLFLGALELILPPLFWWWLKATREPAR